MILKNIFSKKFYWLIFVLFFAFFLTLFLFLPILLGKEPMDIKTYLSALTFKDYLIYLILSILIAFNLVLLIYQKRELKIAILPEVAFKSGTGILGIFSGILATAFCLSCLAPIFALLGLSFGTMLIFLKYKFYFLLIAIILIFLSIYFSLQRIKRKCNC